MTPLLRVSVVRPHQDFIERHPRLCQGVQQDGGGETPAKSSEAPVSSDCDPTSDRTNETHDKKGSPETAGLSLFTRFHMPRRSTWTHEDMDIVESMWGAGYTASQIAQHLGRTRNAVLGRIQRFGLNRCLNQDTQPDAPTREDIAFVWTFKTFAELKRLWADGYTTDEIAVRLGTHEDDVTRRAMDLGLMEYAPMKEVSIGEWAARNNKIFVKAISKAKSAGILDACT